MLKFNEFSNERSEVETAPSPVKPKEKEKERTKTPDKTPDKTPSINPFRRTPDVAPGEEPNPKATIKKVNEWNGEETIKSREGMALASFEETEDEIGYMVKLSFEGSVMKADLPSNWKKQLESALNESEKVLMEKLPWLQ